MIKGLIIFLLELYQQISRNFLNLSVCRFYPSCSEYTKQAILKYGIVLGSLKGVKRMFLCQPLSGESGYDPLL